MAMTLKLSQVSWDQAPYRWTHSEVPDATGPAFWRPGTGDQFKPGLTVVDGETFWTRGEGCNAFVLREVPPGLDAHGFDVEDAPAHDIVEWIGGVKQVVRVADLHPASIVEQLEGEWKHWDVEIHTWMGPEKKTVRPILLVTLEGGETRCLLVERAWLLSDSGQTIERIAP